MEMRGRSQAFDVRELRKNFTSGLSFMAITTVITIYLHTSPRPA
jgi:hypothetical protein